MKRVGASERARKRNRISRYCIVPTYLSLTRCIDELVAVHFHTDHVVVRYFLMFFFFLSVLIVLSFFFYLFLFFSKSCTGVGNSKYVLICNRQSQRLLSCGHQQKSWRCDLLLMKHLNNEHVSCKHHHRFHDIIQTC